MKIQTKRPFLSEMIKKSRKANKKNPLPPPQDVKLRMETGQKIRLSFTRFPEDLTRGGMSDLEQKPIFSGGYRHYVSSEFDLTKSGGGYVVCKGKGELQVV